MSGSGLLVSVGIGSWIGLEKSISALRGVSQRWRTTRPVESLRSVSSPKVL